MKQMINFLKKNNKGHVSIEVLIIGGLIIGLGATTIALFQDRSTEQVQTSIVTIEDKFNSPEFSRIFDR